MNKLTNNYSEAIKAIKSAILKSRYRAAILANREMLSLYFGIGEYVSKNSRKGFWGTNSIEEISEKLQKELPGLRGFSATNMKNMRLFYEAWNNVINRQSITDGIKNIDLKEIEIRQLTTDELDGNNSSGFLRIGFTHHIEIINRVKTREERLFYINHCSAEFWSVEKLKYNLKSNLYRKEGSIISNFTKVISEKDFRRKALNSFKDEYLLDYINIEDPDEADEKVLENEIIQNIKKFIMTLGKDFAFIGNQYRLIVDEKEFFIDLLFFNRYLQSIVAVELKKGEFKAEYAGKMNFYLSVLDEYVKQPHERPSIGIILCKSKKKNIVEFAFKDTLKPMGVATYKTYNELPEEYKNILPDPEKLKELL